MKLYVANCTDQDQVVNVRLPEKKNSFTQWVYIGRQAILGSPDLNTPQIEAIVQHLAIYGARAIMDFENARDLGLTIPLLWNVDQPIPHEVFMRVVDYNRGVLAERGKKLREQAAMATSEHIRERFPVAADTLWMSVQEERPGTLPGNRVLNEGIRMPNAQNDGRPPGV